MKHPTKGMKRKTISLVVRTEDGFGRREVGVWVLGQLAIHVHLGMAVWTWKEKRWAVTHIPTGYMLTHAFDTFSSARSYLDELVDEDWNFYNPKQAPEATRLAWHEAQKAREE